MSKHHQQRHQQTPAPSAPPAVEPDENAQDEASVPLAVSTSADVSSDAVAPPPEATSEEKTSGWVSGTLFARDGSSAPFATEAQGNAVTAWLGEDRSAARVTLDADRGTLCVVSYPDFQKREFRA